MSAGYGEPPSRPASRTTASSRGTWTFGPPSEPLQRQEGRLAAAVLPTRAEEIEGGFRRREALDDNPLEPLPERRLDRPLEVAGHFEQVGDRPHHTVQAGLARGGEHRLDAGP